MACSRYYRKIRVHVPQVPTFVLHVVEALPDDPWYEPGEHVVDAVTSLPIRRDYVFDETAEWDVRATQGDFRFLLGMTEANAAAYLRKLRATFVDLQTTTQVQPKEDYRYDKDFLNASKQRS